MEWDVDPKTIFIRFLPDSVKDFHLHEYFSNFGVIRYIHVSEWHDSRRRAFITFRDLESVREVLEIQPHLLNETPINVFLARIKRSADNGGITFGVAECNSGDGFAASLGNKKADNSAPELDSNHPSIYVGHLTPRITESDLKAYFSNFGLVTGVQIINDKFTGESRGFGFVSFADIGAAESVLENCHFLKQCRVIVKPSNRRSNLHDPSVQPKLVAADQSSKSVENEQKMKKLLQPLVLRKLEEDQNARGQTLAKATSPTPTATGSSEWVRGRVKTDAQNSGRKTSATAISLMANTNISSVWVRGVAKKKKQNSKGQTVRKATSSMFKPASSHSRKRGPVEKQESKTG